MTTNKLKWLLVGLVCLALWPEQAPAQALFTRHASG